MGRGARQNAMRAGVVVLGSLAFGYLSLQVGFKPYLERAREAAERPEPASEPDNCPPQDEFSVSFPQEERRRSKDIVLE